jgi:hypothetical protein
VNSLSTDLWLIDSEYRWSIVVFSHSTLSRAFEEERNDCY